MKAEFRSHLDYLSDEICQVNTRIGCIAHRQSCPSGFIPSPLLVSFIESFDSGDDDSDDASSSTHDDEMTVS